MTVSGFTFIRNGIRFGYPFRESILSLLPLVDELVVAVGRSEDATREALLALNSPKLRLIDTVWNDALREGGRILSEQTNVALDQIKGDWGVYLQGDEVIHEQDYPIIKKALAHYSQHSEIEGLLFNYLHFYGSYDFIGVSRRWYRREIRVVRNGIGIRSWGDAQGFRKGDEKMRVAHVPARIFHYGWVKPPAEQTAKLKSFHRFWHSDAWVEAHVPGSPFRYDNGGKLERFEGSHPAVMHELIRLADWEYDPTASDSSRSAKESVLGWVEERTGWRPGEYRNYLIEDTFANDPK